ncbi:MAG: hypothetical protein E3J72_01915 [Planctomycetota bacterium]|nr:MAG: hypothetical protein E3J72_01915 [Planctomycetota bacterium]
MSSITYPNVMALDYLTVTGAVTPQFKQLATHKISIGYQMLMAYEVTKSGGFSWYGSAPANKNLTTFGLTLFTDMARVAYVDETLIPRMQNFLFSSQDYDGSWSADRTNYLPSYSNDLYSTAYIAGAIAYSGYTGPKLDLARQYIKNNLASALSLYDKALCAEALILINKNDADGISLLNDLAAAVQTSGDENYWQAASGTYGVMYSYGASLNFELTGRIATTMMRAGVHGDLVQGAINYLIAHKDALGNWMTTQSTVYALRTLIMAQGSAGSDNADGTVTITANATTLPAVTITPADADVVRFVSCRDYLQVGANNVTVQFAGTGNPMAQIVWRYYRGRTPPPPGDITIALDYSKVSLTMDETVAVTVNIANTRTNGRGANTVVAEIGIPPGFALSADELELARYQGVIDRYEIAGQQLNIYRNVLDASDSFEINYMLTPTCPLKVQTPVSKAYEYYAPEVGPGRADPILLTVTN